MNNYKVYCTQCGCELEPKIVKTEFDLFSGYPKYYIEYKCSRGTWLNKHTIARAINTWNSLKLERQTEIIGYNI